MKILLIPFLFLFLFLSCKKRTKPNPDVHANAYIQFKANGNLIKIEGTAVISGDQYVDFRKGNIGLPPETVYFLEAQQGITNEFLSTFVVDSLTETSFHFDSLYSAAHRGYFLFGLIANSQNASIYFNEDYCDVTITSYKNGIISGTFSGKLTPFENAPVDYSKRATFILTEGIFSNIQVSY